jgi:hypothetical protein
MIGIKLSCLPGDVHFLLTLYILPQLDLNRHFCTKSYLFRSSLTAMTTTIDEIKPARDFQPVGLEEVPLAAKKLLEAYSKIPESEVLPHVLHIVSKLNHESPVRKLNSSSSKRLEGLRCVA